MAKVKITTRLNEEWEDANNAKVYVGDTLIGELPSTVEKSKVYTFDHEVTGDFVKIVSGTSDGKLSFSKVEVHELKLWPVGDYSSVYSKT